MYANASAYMLRTMLEFAALVQLDYSFLVLLLFVSHTPVKSRVLEGADIISQAKATICYQVVFRANENSFTKKSCATDLLYLTKMHSSSKREC